MNSRHHREGPCTVPSQDPLLALASILSRPDDTVPAEELRSRLLQFQKMAALGRAAVDAAHDMKNLLGVILCYAELLRREPGLDNHVRSQAEQISRAADRAALLAQQVLQFGPRPSVPEPIDLGTFVPGLRQVLSCLTGSALQLAVVPPTGTCRARVDPGEVEQVVMNLVINARDATPRGGRIEVAVAPTRLEHDQSHAAGVVPAGSYARLVVSDTGCGMDAITLSRIFEPFFTTKEPDKGTGLGLSIVSTIVARSAGHLAVSSEPGHGTRFDIYWPLCE